LQIERCQQIEAGDMKKILIVDDQADIRRLISLTLGRQYSLLEAGDGATAISIVETSSPDAVILDVMMPGFDVLAKIKSNKATRSICVVMLTAKGQAADIDRAISKGADAYLIKPFSPLQLIRLLQEHIGG
jgi:CheY-like chemotaxis protein